MSFVLIWAAMMNGTDLATGAGITKRASERKMRHDAYTTGAQKFLTNSPVRGRGLRGGSRRLVD